MGKLSVIFDVVKSDDDARKEKIGRGYRHVLLYFDNDRGDKEYKNVYLEWIVRDGDNATGFSTPNSEELSLPQAWWHHAIPAEIWMKIFLYMYEYPWEDNFEYVEYFEQKSVA